MQRGLIAISVVVLLACLLAPVTYTGAPAQAHAQAAAEVAAGLSVDGLALGDGREKVLGVFKEKYQIVREYIDHLTGVGLIMGAPGKPEDYDSPERIAGFAGGKLFVYAMFKEYDLKPEQYAKWVADFTSRLGAPAAEPPEFLTSCALWEDLGNMVDSETAQTSYWSIPGSKYVLFATFDEDGEEGGFFLLDVPLMDQNYELFMEMSNALF